MAENQHSEVVETVLRDLPKFPRDVVEQWIGYYAQSEGWPPPNPLTGRWARLLNHRPLWFWQTLTWTEELLDPCTMTFTSESSGSIMQIIHANARNEANEYSRFMGDEGKPRFRRLLLFVMQHGHLPKNPIVTRTGRQYDVADGNHRLAAFLAWAKWRQMPEVTANAGITAVPLHERISIWVGSHYGP